MVGRYPFDKSVRSRSNSGDAAVEIGCRFALDNPFRNDGDLGHVDRQCRRRAFGVDTNRLRIDDLGLLDQLGILRIRRRAIRHVRGARNRKRHVFRRESAAVVERDALPEFEFPNVVGDRFPRRGKAGAQFAARTAGYQRIENMMEHGRVRRVDVVMRIDRTGIGPHRHFHIGGMSGQRQQRGRGEKQAAHVQRPFHTGLRFSMKACRASCASSVRDSMTVTPCSQR